MGATSPSMLRTSGAVQYGGCSAQHERRHAKDQGYRASAVRVCDVDLSQGTLRSTSKYTLPTPQPSHWVPASHHKLILQIIGYGVEMQIIGYGVENAPATSCRTPRTSRRPIARASSDHALAGYFLRGVRGGAKRGEMIHTGDVRDHVRLGEPGVRPTTEYLAPMSNGRLPNVSNHRGARGNLDVGFRSGNGAVDHCSKDGGHVVLGVLEEAEPFMGRWHRAGVERSRLRHASENTMAGGKEKEAVGTSL